MRKIVMNRFILFLMACQLTLGLYLLNWPQQVQAETSAQAPDPVAQAQQAFIQAVTADQKKFQVAQSEATDPKALVAKTFGKKILARAQIVHSKEIRVQKSGEASAAHLGLLTLNYATAADATAALGLTQGKKSGYLARTKILTRYQWQQNGAVLLLLYSETGIDEQVEAFFFAMASKQALLAK